MLLLPHLNCAKPVWTLRGDHNIESSQLSTAFLQQNSTCITETGSLFLLYWLHGPVLDVVLCQNACKNPHVVWRAESGKFTDIECEYLCKYVGGLKQVTFRCLSIVLSTRWQRWKFKWMGCSRNFVFFFQKSSRIIKLLLSFKISKTFN